MAQRKVSREFEWFVIFMMVITFISVMVSTFGAVLNLFGLIDKPWLVVFKPFILVLAADISLIVAIITFHLGLNLVLTIWERLNK